MTSPDDEFHQLRRIIETLRGPDGCPWDRKQTLADIPRYLTEETAEVGDAVAESGGEATHAVCDELGDVLMNVLLAARIAEEGGAFSIDDVSKNCREKLVRRHPHVFGDASAETSDEVIVKWNEIKAEEKKARGSSPAFESILADIPRSLPPLARAHKISARAAKVGFDWPKPSGAVAKLREEIEEVEALIGAPDPAEEKTDSESSSRKHELTSELGDVLFAAVNLCRKLGVHSDDALRSTMKKFGERFEHVERNVSDLETATLEEMDGLWNEMRRADEVRLEERDAKSTKRT